MARGRKKKEKVQQVLQFKASDLKSAIAESFRLKDQAKYYSGASGETSKRFIEKTGFSRDAFAVIMKLHKLGDDLKRQSVMDEILMGFELMGWDDQGTLFDRVETKKANGIIAETPEDDDEGETPPFQQNAMPLDKAEKAFEKAAKAKPPKDSLADLAADPEPALTH